MAPNATTRADALLLSLLLSLIVSFNLCLEKPRQPKLTGPGWEIRFQFS